MFTKFLGVDGQVSETEKELQYVGFISDASWDQLGNASLTVNEVLQYAILQLNDIADRINAAQDTRSAKDTLSKVRPEIKEWLSVSADCLTLRNRIDLLKMQRFVDTGMEPDLLSKQQFVIMENQHARYQSLTRATGGLQEAVKGIVKGKDDTMRVILLPLDAPVVIRESNEIAAALAQFDRALGNVYDTPHYNEKQWNQAMGEIGQGIADGTAQAAQQAGNALQQAGNAMDDARKQVSDAVGKAANDVGDQLKKAFSGFPKLW